MNTPTIQATGGLHERASSLSHIRGGYRVSEGANGWEVRSRSVGQLIDTFTDRPFVDVPAGVNMRPFVPPGCRRLWDETEDDSSYEYGYLEGQWERGHHRKWVAILDQARFDEFVGHVGLAAEDVQTMGSIAAPGLGWGWAPAISFRNDDPDAIASAYVTPCGIKAEIVRFLQEHEVPVPAVLRDDDSQGYLWPDAVDREAPWEALRQAVILAYS